MRAAAPPEQFATLDGNGRAIWLPLREMTPRQRLLAERALHQLSGKLDAQAAAAPERTRHEAWAKADDARMKLARFLLSPRRGRHRKPREMPAEELPAR
jgi:hypothetical protein